MKQEDPPIQLNDGHRREIDTYRSIPWGGLILLATTTFFLAAFVLSFFVLRYMFSAADPFHDVWFACGTVWLTGHAGTLTIYLAMLCFTRHTGPYVWLSRYYRLNVLGACIAYVRCLTHGHNSLLLIEPDHMTHNWICVHEHKGDERTCCYVSLVLPLGGWRARGYIDKRHPSHLHGFLKPYRPYSDVKVQCYYNDPAYVSPGVILEDSNGDRLSFLVWDMLKFVPFLAVSGIRTWHKVINNLKGDREMQLEVACRFLFLDLVMTEKRLRGTRRFIRSKQAFAIRVQLLKDIATWREKLSHDGLMPSTADELRAVNAEYNQALSQLENMNATPDQPSI